MFEWESDRVQVFPLVGEVESVAIVVRGNDLSGLQTQFSL